MVNGCYTSMFNDIIEVYQDNFFFGEEKSWKQQKSKHKLAVFEWVKEPDVELFAKQAKKRFAVQRIAFLDEKVIDLRKLYVEISQDKSALWMLELVEKQAHTLLKEKKRYSMSLEEKNSSKAIITQEDIERAKEYPISSIVEIGRNGRARCVFHNGEDFNMGIKNNIARCFVCGSFGDAISVHRALTGKGFVESVRELSGKV